MALSPILKFTKWTASQSQPEVTVNAAMDVLDAAHDALVHDMASDADYTLEYSVGGTEPYEWQQQVIVITDTGVVLTTGRNIITQLYAKMYVFINRTAQTMTLKTSTGTGIAIAADTMAYLRSDGVNIVRLSTNTMTLG